MKTAVVLFNLGGPDSPEAVEPFLRNLFSDPAIIGLPAPLRLPLAKWIARRRAPVAREIYARLGGRSPILEETRAQAEALERVLRDSGLDARVFVCMRCWNPRSDEVAGDVSRWKPDRIVLLPLYPQYSTTTTASALRDWTGAAAKAGLHAPSTRVCCFHTQDDFIAALAETIRQTWSAVQPDIRYRLLLSAHGLPERVIRRGDPYRWQVERTGRALVDRLAMADLDWSVCYQSRVGPLKWIGPATDEEIRRAGRDGMGVVIAPIAFVSEHSETLVELDMEYRALAKACGVRDYLRAPAVGIRESFIRALAELVAMAGAGAKTVAGSGLCPAEFRCGMREKGQ